MSDLWLVFTENLMSSGYTLDELNGNDDLFQSVVKDICNFSFHQVKELKKEWQLFKLQNTGKKNSKVRQGGAWQMTKRSSLYSNNSVTPQGAFNLYPTSAVLSRANAFLSNLCVNGVRMLSASVIELPFSFQLNQKFRLRLASLNKATEEVGLMWRLCGPSALASLEEGRPLTSQDSFDPLCPGGFVLYRDNGTPAHLIDGSLAELVSRGWCLVAFDVAVGNSRCLEVEEVRLLQNFSMDELFNSLNNDGYDSVRVASCNAFVFFHPDQLFPRFVVTIQTSNSPQPNYFRKASTARTGVNFSVNNSPHQARPTDGQVANVVTKSAEKSRSMSVLDTPRKEPSRPNTAMTKCCRHSGKEMEFWCPKKKRLLCSHCLFYYGYSKSSCVVLPEAVQQEAEGMTRWVKNARVFLSEVGDVENLFYSAERDINRCEEKEKKELRERFQRAHIQLNSMEEKLLAQVKDKSAQQRQSLRYCLADVQATIKKVKQIIGNAEGPLSNYREGNINHETAIVFLQALQSAFDDWNLISISMYNVVTGVKQDIFEGIEAALESAHVTEDVGHVELPEAIDVNYFKA